MSKTNHPISWFEQRRGKLVTRNGRAFKIPNKEAAQYCFQLQEEGYVFTDPQDYKSEVKISYAPDSICTACEG